jgi:hypothetical protein
MERFTSYLDGMGIVNQTPTPITGYNYFGYNRWGSEEWAIMKEAEDHSTMQYLIGVDLTEYATAWANKTGLSFKSPSQLCLRKY